MLNKFKNALYGASTTDDSPSLDVAYTDYKDTVIGRRIRGALTRSSSFRDELLSDVTKNRVTDNRNSNDDTYTSGIHRVKSQMLRKSQSITEEREFKSPNMTPSANFGQYSRAKEQFTTTTDSKRPGQKVAKFRYTRPEFLQLKTDDEIGVSADHQIRPIILPRDVSRLPWLSGYAECINAGKSVKNEDQAVCYQDVVVGTNSRSDNIRGQLPFTIFGLYDGHAGNAVAVAAAAQLHHIISEKLRHVADILLALEFGFEDADNNDDEEFEDCINSLMTSNKEASVQDGNQPKNRENLQSRNETTIHNDDDKKTTTIAEEHEVPEDKEQTKFLDETDCSNLPTLPEGAQVDSNNESYSQTPEPPSSSSQPKTDQTDDMLECDKSESDVPMISATSNSMERSNHVDSENVSTLNERFSADLELKHSFIASVNDISRNNITVESLVKGALESAFWEMDELIGRDKEFYKMPGGCAAIVSLFVLGKLYVCNAGDSRAIVCKGNQVIPMSFDFTPTSERERILRLGHQRPELLGNDFTHLEFIRRPTRRDLGKRMLYRDAYMTGWSMKEISYDDLKFPLVWGEGKRSRLCACIGLSRGFGDHELRAQYGSVPIKPFMTPEPEVRVLDLENENELTNEDVLIQASDGLWDVATNHEIFELVKRSLSIDNEVARSKYRYISVAQDLVGWSRGCTTENCSWRMSDGRFASMDDISVFVVPLKQYRDEYLEWKRLRNEVTATNTKNHWGNDRE